MYCAGPGGRATDQASTQQIHTALLLLLLLLALPLVRRHPALRAGSAQPPRCALGQLWQGTAEVAQCHRGWATDQATTRPTCL